MSGEPTRQLSSLNGTCRCLILLVVVSVSLSRSCSLDYTDVDDGGCAIIELGYDTDLATTVETTHMWL